ncbi:putative addiction module killer protein [Geopseudomonas sagittaria]|jgi:putative addiction module killer protein|uniref:Putative addiction module killer protein n=1 Tax=Geopseudomonas sagittaria TaxID=1135990 RepID=A0A1I5WRM6_9GAMM|nr:putative addiction module killer protein [Pseudomonas sagittaria]
MSRSKSSLQPAGACASYPIGYTRCLNYLIQQTDTFANWHTALRDLRARIAIARRIDRAAAGNLGDVKPVGEGVSEMRVDVGPGYRLYFTRRGEMLILLLCGGDKSSQSRDIALAKRLAGEIE